MPDRPLPTGGASGPATARGPSRSARAALCAAGLVAALAADPARARSDTQAWGSLLATGAVRGDLFLWLEAQGRATDEIGGGSQILLRPAIGKRIGRDAHVVAGYAYVRTDPATGATTHEHRPWQQVQFVPVRRANGDPLIVSRTRLEQRMVEGRAGTGWRLRQLVRAQLPVARGGAIKAVAFTEGFVNLNATRGGVRDGVDQWRSFVGLGLPVAPRIRVEPGYLNQRIFRPGDDRVNHVLNATLLVSL